MDDYSYDIESLKRELQELMWDNAGIIRSEDLLNEALKKIKLLKNTFRQTKRCQSIEEYEYRNMLEVSELIVKAALDRKESRGAHYRSDYPNTYEVAEHSLIKKGELQLVN